MATARKQASDLMVDPHLVNQEQGIGRPKQRAHDKPAHGAIPKPSQLRRVGNEETANVSPPLRHQRHFPLQDLRHIGELIPILRLDGAQEPMGI